MLQRITWRQAALACLAFVLGWYSWQHRETSWSAAQAQGALEEAAPFLQGTVVVIDPGHGGRDPGAVVSGVDEKEIVLNIGKELKALMEQHGAKVILTRDSDTDFAPIIRHDLEKRLDVVRETRPNAFVSIHANKDSCRCWGAQTFYQRSGPPAAKALAIAIQGRLKQLTPTTRSALHADYYLLRNAPVPATIVEVGFMTYPEELARLKEPAYQQKLALSIALGLADYFKRQPTAGPPAP